MNALTDEAVRLVNKVAKEGAILGCTDNDGAIVRLVYRMAAKIEQLEQELHDGPPRYK